MQKYKSGLDWGFGMEPLRQERVPSEETNVLLLPHTVFNTAKIYSLSCDRIQ